MAEVSVRLARLADVEAAAAAQLRAWQSDGVIPPTALEGHDESVVARGWERAVLAPPSRRHQLLVALDGDHVVGLAAIAPATDPDCDPETDTELLLLVVDPDARHQGHGSRLLAAAAHHAADGGALRLYVWVAANDDLLRAFLDAADWAADGAHRTLDRYGDETVLLRQVRLGTTLDGSPDAA
jgi:ribosomal protein S18 acetylase RimI-like enzyme